MKILLVEDDRDLCNTVKLQLERAGYETDVCYQGQDALFYANQYPYDVIVLDRMLPQVDGLTIPGRQRCSGGSRRLFPCIAPMHHSHSE